SSRTVTPMSRRFVAFRVSLTGAMTSSPRVRRMRTIAVPMNPFAPETQILREPALVTGSGAGAAPWVRLGLAPLRAFGEADFAVAGFGFAVAAFGFAGTGFGAGDFGL